MDYSLAKKLKDSGWPQRVNVNHRPIPPEDDYAYFPDLSELIEACLSRGKGAITLYCLKGRYIAHQEAKHDIKPENECKSPEEAVARLWLRIEDK